MYSITTITPGLTSDTACESVGRVSSSDGGESGAGAAAARWGVWGAARALRAALRERGVRVMLLHTPDLSAADVYAPPQQLAATSPPARLVQWFAHLIVKKLV